MRLAVYNDGLLKVTIPHRVSEKKAEEFIIEKHKWIVDKIEQHKKNPRSVIKHTKEEIKEYKEKASVLVAERLKYWNKYYNFNYKKIAIKNTKSRWGSCSKAGNLNFNYKVALLSQELADYIVVHELCHLGEMNHSKKFWNLVCLAIPNHKELRKQLKNKF